MTVKPSTAQQSKVFSTRQQIILFSPIIVIVICQITARMLAPVFGNWTVYPWLLVYWAITGLFIYFGYWESGPALIQRWADKPRGSWLWSALALLFLPMTFPIFIDGRHLLQGGWLWLPWLLFAPINSLFEEGYWRGLLMDAGKRWPGWAVILYTSLFFSLNHLSLSAFVQVYQSWFSLISPIVAGLLYGLVYWKTGSLRWIVISHTLVNWFGLGMLVLMNVYVPVTP